MTLTAMCNFIFYLYTLEADKKRRAPVKIESHHIGLNSLQSLLQGGPERHPEFISIFSHCSHNEHGYTNLF